MCLQHRRILAVLFSGNYLIVGMEQEVKSHRLTANFIVLISFGLFKKNSDIFLGTFIPCILVYF